MRKLKDAMEMLLDEEQAQFDEGLKKDYIKLLRERSGMSQNQFAKYLNIPPSTLKKWEQGQRECPVYVVELIEYKLRNEKLIKGFDDFMKSIDK